MDIGKFEELEKEICDFAKRVREQVEVHYKGPFITGKLEKPEVLFLSFNPGGGDKKVVKCGKFDTNIPIKYQSELQDKGEKLAVAIYDIFEKSAVDNSCETYIDSFFATKDLDALKELFKQNHELRKEHDDLMKKLLELVTEQNEPKKIVCIGLEGFYDFCTQNNLEWKIEKKVGERKYLLSTTYKQTPVYGIIHLSGARPSRLMLEELKTFFQQN